MRPRHLRYHGIGPGGTHELHALEWGARSRGRVVVCAHGYSGNARDFDFLAAALARDGARVICPDVAGRGESAWLDSPLAYHFARLLSDFRTLLAETGATQVDWIGTSMGALLGMLLASEARTPIRRLVMNDVGAFVPSDALQRIGRNLRAPQRFASRAEAEAHIRATHAEWGEISEPQWRHLVRHGIRKAGDGYRMHYDPLLAQLVQPMPFAPGLFFWSEWYRVACPVLLVRGEHSEVLPSSVAAAMLAVKPQADLVEIAGAGHAPALMSPAEIAAIREFLEAPRDPGASTASPSRPRQARMGPGAWSAS